MTITLNKNLPHLPISPRPRPTLPTLPTLPIPDSRLPTPDSRLPKKTLRNVALFLNIRYICLHN
ncbi:hypothetical protein [Moorena sp. SIO3B2]|uniref:hypothetical protein n=1 Tax=Moorena sp. SIO3B2 TaxID=2607827 RepID=UPI0013C914EB|nr:hypothetical protein [Moorena sp. SIO3B2]NEP37730.1 hypothetical protein [Moorena sp. SIO3B2]NES86809.1 hypothetical protein [Moorena sp. SIO2B7]